MDVTGPGMAWTVVAVLAAAVVVVGTSRRPWAHRRLGALLRSVAVLAAAVVATWEITSVAVHWARQHVAGAPASFPGSSLLHHGYRPAVDVAAGASVLVVLLLVAEALIHLGGWGQAVGAGRRRRSRVAPARATTAPRPAPLTPEPAPVTAERAPRSHQVIIDLRALREPTGDAPVPAEGVPAEGVPAEAGAGASSTSR